MTNTKRRVGFMAENPTIRCPCGVEEPRRSATHVYCVKCSEERNRLRQNRWDRTHPPSELKAANRLTSQRANQEMTKEAGIHVSVAQRSSGTWMAEDVTPIWIVRVCVPFSYAASKNHIYAVTGQGHRTLRSESSDLRQRLVDEMVLALKGRRIAQAKLWIDILVQKSNHRGDAVNVVDLICDGLVHATGLDDRWYCIRRLDWEIVKEDPVIYIGIGQETREDQRVCSACGQLLPFEAFGPADTKRIARYCKECRRLGRLEAKAAQKK